MPRMVQWRAIRLTNGRSGRGPPGSVEAQNAAWGSNRPWSIPCIPEDVAATHILLYIQVFMDFPPESADALQDGHQGTPATEYGSCCKGQTRAGSASMDAWIHYLDTPME